jgi:hypothetical protein
MAKNMNTTTAPGAHIKTAAELLPSWIALRDEIPSATGQAGDAAVAEMFAMSERIAAAPAPTAADVAAKITIALHHAHIEHDTVAANGRDETLPWHWSIVEAAATDLARFA